MAKPAPKSALARPRSLARLRPLNSFLKWMESTGAWAPWCFLGLFIAASFLMIWRLEAMTESGVEGTVLGTLVMPYCSGMGNLIFAFVLGAKGGPGAEVVTNSLVNNVTNMTLLIGLPAILWGMNVLPAAKSKKKKPNRTKEHQINRLSLLLTLTAVLFFTGAVWALARKGRLDFGDGLVLVGLFLFWQCFHVFDVLKSNVRQNKSFSWMLPFDLAVLAIGAYALYLSTDWLVDWLSQHPQRLHQRPATWAGSAAGSMSCPTPCSPSTTAGAGTPKSSIPPRSATGISASPSASGSTPSTGPCSCPPSSRPGCASSSARPCSTSSSSPSSGACPGSWAGC